MPYAHGIDEHDCVRFTQPVGRWSAGTEGTVVNTRADGVEVEIVDRSSGYTLDVVDAPIDAVEVTWIQGIRAAV